MKATPFTRKLAHNQGFSTLHCNTLQNNADPHGDCTVAKGSFLAQCGKVEMKLIIALLSGHSKSLKDEGGISAQEHPCAKQYNRLR